MTGKIILNDAIKTFTLDQDKILAPAETVKKFKEKERKKRIRYLQSWYQDPRKFRGVCSCTIHRCLNV